MGCVGELSAKKKTRSAECGEEAQCADMKIVVEYDMTSESACENNKKKAKGCSEDRKWSTCTKTNNKQRRCGARNAQVLRCEWQKEGKEGN